MVHIRITPTTTICGSAGGSVRLEHVHEQPQHINSLPMCQACKARAAELAKQGTL